MKKSILHFGNLAGIPYYHALSLRKIGLFSVSVKRQEEETFAYEKDKILNRKLPTDEVLLAKTDNKIVRSLKKARFIGRQILQSNAVHYYGETIWKIVDPALFQFFDIPCIISWGGTDARIVEMARKNNPYFHRSPDPAHDYRIKKMLENISRYVHYVATDPEMEEYSRPFFKKIFIVKQPVDLTECTFQPPEKTNICPVLLHIPTHSEVKGTKHIEAAIDKLQSEGYSFKFIKMEPNLTQKQVKSELSKADIYIDELRCGSYGMTAVEAMACGKPTLTYIREDLVDKFPKELPIVNSNPDTIYIKIRELLKDAELRTEIGVKSRAYAEKYHSLEAIGPQLMTIYKEIGLKT